MDGITLDIIITKIGRSEEFSKAEKLAIGLNTMAKVTDIDWNDKTGFAEWYTKACKVRQENFSMCRDLSGGIRQIFRNGLVAELVGIILSGVSDQLRSAAPTMAEEAFEVLISDSSATSASAASDAATGSKEAAHEAEKLKAAHTHAEAEATVARQRLEAAREQVKRAREEVASATAVLRLAETDEADAAELSRLADEAAAEALRAVEAASTTPPASQKKRGEKTPAPTPGKKRAEKASAPARGKKRVETAAEKEFKAKVLDRFKGLTLSDALSSVLTFVEDIEEIGGKATEVVAELDSEKGVDNVLEVYSKMTRIIHPMKRKGFCELPKEVQFKCDTVMTALFGVKKAQEKAGRL